MLKEKKLIEKGRLEMVEERSGLKLVLKDKKGKVKVKQEFIKGKWKKEDKSLS